MSQHQWTVGLRAQSAVYGILPLPEVLQSTLHPETFIAREITTLTWVMIIGAAVIFIIVAALAAYAVLGRSGALKRRLGTRRLIIGAGAIFPAVTLTALLIYALVAADRIVETGAPAAVRIAVTGAQFWWQVRYLDEAGNTQAISANEIHMPAGRPVDLSVTSTDVIHSFWVPNLAGKIDMIPGRTNTLRIAVDQTGTWRGQCAEYCGAQHARMAFYVVVESPEDFAAWLALQRQPAAEPTDPFLQRGKALFLSKDCGRKECCRDCHTLRGTPAKGDHAPDLTHVGGRRWIAAGTLPNNAGTLAGWIASAQHIKPNSLMPEFDRYSGEDLRALAAYLESLK